MIWDWIMRNPHPTVAMLATLSAACVWLGRFAFTRHREFVAFTAHMRREEEQVWPELSEQIRQNHEQAIELLQQHGERIAKLEAKMPNGEIREIRDIVKALWERGGKPR